MAELDDAELPEFTEEDAAAELGEEAELEAPAESEVRPSLMMQSFQNLPKKMRQLS